MFAFIHSFRSSLTFTSPHGPVSAHKSVASTVQSEPLVYNHMHVHVHYIDTRSTTQLYYHQRCEGQKVHLTIQPILYL